MDNLVICFTTWRVFFFNKSSKELGVRFSWWSACRACAKLCVQSPAPLKLSVVTYACHSSAGEEEAREHKLLRSSSHTHHGAVWDSASYSKEVYIWRKRVWRNLCGNRFVNHLFVCFLQWKGMSVGPHISNYCDFELDTSLEISFNAISLLCCEETAWPKQFIWKRTLNWGLAYSFEA